MATRELPDFLDDGALKYPLKSSKHPDGKTYVLVPADSERGLRLASLGELAMMPSAELTKAQRERLNLDDDQEFDFYADILGDALEEMKADGVPFPKLKQVAQDAFAYWYLDPSVADAILASQGEAVAVANRKDRRAAAKKAPAKAATKRALQPSSRKATSRSSRASSATPAPTRSRTSTRSSKTSAPSARAATA